MTGVFRWGIVGTGVVARRFAVSLRFARGCEATAVASRDPEHARAFAHALGLRRAHASLKELARDEELDAVYLATPIERHAEHVRALLASGRPVLCEKPLAGTAEEARALVEVARRAGVFLMEGLWMRFVPMIAELRRRVRSGELGAPRLLQADLAFPFEEDASTPRFAAGTGGGALRSLGVYPVSLAFDLLGPPRTVQGSTLCTEHGVDRQATITLGYDGAQAVLTCGFGGRGRNDATLVAERGRVRLDAPLYAPEAMTVTTWPGPAEGSARGAGGRGVERVHERWPSLVGPWRRGLPLLRRLLGRDRRLRRPFPGFGYQFEAQEVARCVREGLAESPILPLDESVAVLAVLDRVRGSPAV